ncbi:MAG TPA: VOC family protein [Solirubrobacteraceae bacterium]|nr:VOC family protein [Solirubrobacteraceae bacterium]
MQLDGMHHITMITGDAQRNVDFYADALGLRLVKKTVNFDSPEAYHLYFGDEQGSPGSILTWFEFAGVRPGRAGAGMIHTIQLGVPSQESLDFWEQRLGQKGYSSERSEGSASPASPASSARSASSLKFADYDGLGLELVLANPDTAPLRAVHPEIPAEHAITGVEGARAYVGRPLEADAQLLTETLGFTATDATGNYRLAGPTRTFNWAYEPTSEHGIQGAGTVHHIAWHSTDADHVPWQQRVAAAGMNVTPVIDRDYFHAIYFRQPQGILFEIATTSPGFATDEAPDHLGEALRLPAQHEHLRAHLERTLTPLANPRAAAAASEV